MPSVSVDHAKAAKLLEEAWEEAQKRESKLDENIKAKIKTVLDYDIVAYTYIMITGILARRTNPEANALAIQAGSKLKGAYDARSLCQGSHGVIVPFEHDRGNMWGYSNEPFVSKALRHPEFNKNNKQLRYKTEAATVQYVLEWANNANEDSLFEALVYLMHLGMEHIASIPKATPAEGRNLEAVRCFLHAFLNGPSDGGSRLVAGMGAFMQVFNPDAEVKTFNPNDSDEFAKRVGDIEVGVGGKVITGFECKDRAFAVQDIKDGIKKASDSGVSEYVFVSGFNSEKINYDFSHDSKETGLDLYCIHIPDVLDNWINALYIKKRALLPKLIIDGLVKMRMVDVAKVAELEWKKCLDKFG